MPKFTLIPGTLRSKPKSKSSAGLELPIQELSVFEYLYRDGANYKSWGTMVLMGRATESDRQVIRNQFESGEQFIAEQLGIPALYSELWEFSDGPTEDDHVWHTFYELREFGSDDVSKVAHGTVADLVAKISAVKEWDVELSPHWDA